MLYNYNTLQVVKEIPFYLELEIQRLFEKNLEVITGLELVKSEFIIKNKRIDTLAFDNESNAFVIIEYKRDKNFSIMDQGFAYLALMLENKAEFIVEYNERLVLSGVEVLKRNDVDWTKSKIMFVSTGFIDNQLQAAKFFQRNGFPKDIAIELWEVKRFNNDTVMINEVK